MTEERFPTPPLYIQVLQAIAEGRIRIEEGQFIRVPATRVSLQEIFIYIDEIAGHKFVRDTVSKLGIYQIIFPFHKGKYYLIHNRRRQLAIVFKDMKSERMPAVASDVIDTVAGELIKQYNLPKRYTTSEDDFAVEYYFSSYWTPHLLRFVKTWKTTNLAVEGVQTSVYIKTAGKKAWAVLLADDFLDLLQNVIEVKMKLIDQLSQLKTFS